MIRAMLQGRKVLAGAKAALMLAGCYPTRHWTAAHGSTGHDLCS
jgi:hypothetical protein